MGDIFGKYWMILEIIPVIIWAPNQITTIKPATLWTLWSSGVRELYKKFYCNAGIVAPKVKPIMTNANN